MPSVVSHVSLDAKHTPPPRHASAARLPSHLHPGLPDDADAQQFTQALELCAFARRAALSITPPTFQRSW